MKKLLATLIALTLLITATVVGVFTLPTSAATEYTSGGYKYTVSDGKATITDYTGSATTLTIPSKLGGYPVTTIGYGAFNWCEKLKSITIPDGVTSIVMYAFEGCTGLTSITIPDSVTSIDPWAFSNCARLTSITIPDSVTSIGEGVFRSCSRLQELTIPFLGDKLNSTKQILFGYFFGDDSRWGNENRVPKSLKTVVITGGTKINNYAFIDCTGLTSITIPNTVTSIGNDAFAYCTGLTSVTIPDSVTSIGLGAFSGCSRLKKMTIPFVGNKLNGTKNTHFGYIFGTYSSSSDNDYVPNSLKTLVITGGTKISKDAFGRCTSLTTVTIGDGVTTIGPAAFYNCKKLTTVIIPDSVTSIGEYVFLQCRNLTSVTIPDSVTSIGESAFEYCTSLTSVTIPDSVTSIGEYVFLQCRNLTSVTIPDSVTTIGKYAFYDCEKLTTVTIPDSVTTIGEYAFCDCEKLKSVNYSGYYKDAQKITIGSKNDNLTNASWKYKSCKHIYTNKCDTACNRCKMPRTVQHKYKTVVAKKATQKANGYTVDRCSVCKKEINKKTIYKASKISCSKTAYTYNGKVQKPTVTIKNSNGKRISSSNYTIKYSAGSKNVGTYKVTITFKNQYSGTKTYTYTINPTLKTDMSLIVNYKTGSIGAKSNTKITYTSTNPKVAKVSTKGVVTAVKAGTTYITVKSGSIARRVKVVVQKPKVTISAKANSVYRGKKLQLRATTNLPGVKVTWSVSNKKIAKISKSGVITGAKKGMVTVTAQFTYKGKSYKSTYKVTVKVETPKLYLENYRDTTNKEKTEYYTNVDKITFWNYGNKAITVLARGSIKNYINRSDISSLSLRDGSGDYEKFIVPADGGFTLTLRYKKGEVWITNDTVYVVYFEYDGELYTATFDKNTGKTIITHKGHA